MAQSHILNLRWLQDSQIVEDRFLSKNDTIFVGTHPSNTFIVDSKQIDKHPLFIKNDQGYMLSFLDGMEGEVLLNNQKAPLEQLKSQAKKQGNSYIVSLPEKVKGRVKVGSTTILFQMVPPPESETASRLPWKMRSGMHIYHDPMWMGFFLVSAFIHFSTLAYVATRNLPPLDSLFASVKDIEELPVNFQELTYIPDVKIPEPEIPELPTESPVTVEKTETTPAPKEKTSPKSQQTKTAQAPKEESVTSKGLLGVITAKKKKSGTFVDVLQSSEDKKVNDVIGQIEGVRYAKEGTDVKSIKRDMQGKAGKIADIADLGKKPVADIKGTTIEEKKTVAHVDTSGKIKTIGASVLGESDEKKIRKTVGENSTGIKYCYDRELKSDASLRGKVVVEFTINTSGKVTKFKLIEEETTLNNDTISSCILRKVKTWSFPSLDKEVTVRFPFVFSAVT